MRLYLDASALVKLLHTEPETAALRRYLRKHRELGRVTSALSRTEVVRALRLHGADGVTRARVLLERIDQIRLNVRVLDEAATLDAGSTRLRSLDAIHLASARRLAGDLYAIITYDARMAAAANALTMTVIAPS